MACACFLISISLCCIGFALWFYNVYPIEDNPSSYFLLLILAVFGIAGIAILFKLPGLSAELWRENGYRLFVANAQGIRHRNNLGDIWHHKSWSEISEIQLADQLKVLDAEGTTSYSRSLLIFLKTELTDENSGVNRYERIISHSGFNRPYLHQTYPRASAKDLMEALRRFVPARIEINFHAKAIFNLKEFHDFFTDVGFQLKPGRILKTTGYEQPALCLFWAAEDRPFLPSTMKIDLETIVQINALPPLFHQPA